MAQPIDTVDLRARTAAGDLEASLRATGFVQLIGHGIDANARAVMRAASDDFFALDVETKKRFVHPDPGANRGYRAKGSEALAYSLGEESPPDLFESFNSGPEPAVVSPLLQPTPWPDEFVPGFSAAATACHASFTELVDRLDMMIGSLIGAPWLADRSGRGPDTLVSIRYEPGPDGTEPVVDGQQRMGAHSDYTTFTLLDADPVPGLQILGSDGAWADVIPEEGALLMNVGDLLAILTNNAWPSALHRVVPMSAGGAAVRRSIAFFHYPNLDVEVRVLPRFISEQRPLSYGPVLVEDHLTDKLIAPKDKVRSSGTTTTAGRVV